MTSTLEGRIPIVPDRTNESDTASVSTAIAAGALLGDASQDVVLTVVKRLRSRAARLHTQAQVGLLLIFLSLVGGLWLFGYAGQLAILDVQRSTQALDTRISSVLEQKNQVERKLVEAENQIKYAPTSQVGCNYSYNLDSLKVEQGFVNRELEALRNQQANAKTNSNEQLISVITTRVGSVLLLVFLVQILTTIYRYSTRLAAHYEARADALDLLVALPSYQLPAIVSALSPEVVDFGRGASAPSQPLVDLIQQLLPKQK